MSLPAPPGPRIAYDLDGTLLILSRTFGDSRTPYSADPEALRGLNSDLGGGLVIHGSASGLSEAVGGTLWDLPQGEGLYYSKNFVALLLPHPTHLMGYFMSAPSRWGRLSGATQIQTLVSVPLYVELQTSQDTTNGLDGTWTTVAFMDEEATSHLPTSIQAAANITQPALHPTGLSSGGAIFRLNNTDNQRGEVLTPDNRMFLDGSLGEYGWKTVAGTGTRNVRAIRLYFPRTPPSGLESSMNFICTILNLHLYGEIDTNASDQRVELVDATTGTAAALDLSWGNLDLDETQIKSFKIRNLSETLTAGGVTVSLEDSFPNGVPESVSALQLSVDGVEWESSVSVADITPEGTSSEVFVRLTPTPGIFGLRTARIQTQVGDWS